ncbi:glycerate kinase [Arthrobacter sp. zg-Y769]|uniref:glycerate kinase n=1 Tax=Arthrobacter sp. zg-Y769 TaxID=2894191 RepID=UPI0022B17F7A|nr:glycerate kinase [Arthrobacter sp. zg-Y769]
MAPDSFKGTMDARDVAAAMRKGWAAERPQDHVTLAPMADGGEGTLEAFAFAYPTAKRCPITVQGPDNRNVQTEWLLLPDGRAVIELASTSGITLIGTPDPLGAHTRGFGQAIRAAHAAGVNGMILAVGGSCSTDGGVGALRELGAVFRDENGEEIADGGAGLSHCMDVDLESLLDLPPNGVEVLCDVTNPLCGDLGAARVFGPQKGATEKDISFLDNALQQLVHAVSQHNQGAAKLAVTPGAGAAGGMAYGLLLWGAQIAAGSQAVGDALGLPGIISSADMVITGEGRFDRQSAAGKVPSYILRLAALQGIPAALVAGQIEGPVSGFTSSCSLLELAGSAAEAMASPGRWVVQATAKIATQNR